MLWRSRSGVWPFILSSMYPLIRSLSLGRCGFHLDRGLARPLARARVGARALPAHGQALAVARTAITAQIHQALDRHRHLAPQIALDREFSHLFAQAFHVGIRQIFDLGRRYDLGSVADRLRARPPDAEDRG